MYVVFNIYTPPGIISFFVQYLHYHDNVCHTHDILYYCSMHTVYYCNIHVHVYMHTTNMQHVEIQINKWSTNESFSRLGYYSVFCYLLLTVSHVPPRSDLKVMPVCPCLRNV